MAKRKERKMISRGLANKIIILGIPGVILAAILIYTIVALIATGVKVNSINKTFCNEGEYTTTSEDGTTSTAQKEKSDAAYLSDASTIKTAIQDFNSYYSDNNAFNHIERYSSYADYAAKNELVVRFQATDYNYTSDTQIVYTCALAKNSEFDKTLTTISSSYYARAAICIAAGGQFEKYYTSMLNYTSTYMNSSITSSAYERTATISYDNAFPQTVKSVPFGWFSFKTDAPKAYLYLQYKYTENAVTVAKQAVIEYSFDDYYVTKAEYEADAALEKPLGYKATKGGKLK